MRRKTEYTEREREINREIYIERDRRGRERDGERDKNKREDIDR